MEESQKRQRRAEVAARHAETEPEAMSLRTIQTFLSHHGILQSGPRVLLNWRVHQMRAGLPVVRSPGAAVPFEQVRWTEIVPGTISYFQCGREDMAASILHVPYDVVKTHVLPALDDRSLLSFMFMSRAFYNLCWRHLMERAQQQFGAGASPLALSWYYHYVDIAEKQHPKSALHRSNIAKVLHIRQAYINKTYAQKDELESLLKISIRENGSVDVLKQMPDYEARQKLAREMQQRYVVECKPQRIADVNAAFARQGLGCLTFDGENFAKSDIVACALRMLRGVDWYKRFRRSVREYVNMSSDASDPPAAFVYGEALALMVQIAMTTLATHNKRPAKTAEHYMYGPVLARELQTLKGSEGQLWTERVAHLFSAEFLTASWPNQGTLLCIWHEKAASVRLVELSAMYYLDRQELMKMLTAFRMSEEARTGGKLVFGKPSGGSSGPPSLIVFSSGSPARLIHATLS